MGSPLGKYSDAAATIVGVGTVLAWLGVHLFLIVAQSLGGADVPPGTTSQLDLAGIAALGLILGQRATTNGAAAIAAATNLRLDAIGAPSAPAARSIMADAGAAAASAADHGVTGAH